MIFRLVTRSIAQRPARSGLLLGGYALGVGVTVALLSIASALLTQARDRDLIGGGDLAVLPAGLDLETFRTGGVSSLYFTIKQAPFLYREVLASPRNADRVVAAAPWLENALLYLHLGDGVRAASATGEIPGLARALGVTRDVIDGRWENLPIDDAWLAPSDSLLYAELDGFHVPPERARGDTTWAEWHYFNVLLPGDEGWLYLTYMVVGDPANGRGGGRMLGTLLRREANGELTERQYEAEVPASEVAFSQRRPDVRIGDSEVRLDSAGVYHLSATIEGADARDPLRLSLAVRSDARRYVPPLEVASGDVISGYTVPMLHAEASGTVCAGNICSELRGERAYHDHNWGTWADVTWDWGTMRAHPYALVYGGVLERGDPVGPRFLFLTDSLGFRRVLDIEEITYQRRSDGGEAGAPAAPETLRLLARSGLDSLVLEIDVGHARATVLGDLESPGADGRTFFQMRGHGVLRGALAGEVLEGAGDGFFETWSAHGALVPATSE